MNNKTPQRKCLGCNIIKNKNELVRIVKNKQNEIFVDETKNKDGRGAYICNNVECLEKAINFRRLNNEFKMKIEEEIYTDIRRKVFGRG